MPLIRSSSSPMKVVQFSLRDIEAQAATILNDARRQAEQIIEEARATASQLHDEGIEKGHENGWEAGFSAGRVNGADRAFNECGPQVEAALASLQLAAEAIPAVLEELEAIALSDVVELSIAIAERITKRAGIIDAGVLEENLRDAMKLVVRANGVRISIHPQQMDVLNALLPALKIEWPALANAQIVADESVTPGGCRISTSHSEVNADLAAQLDRLAAKLLPRRGEGAT